MGIGKLVLLGFLLFIAIKLIKGEKIKLGKWLLWGLLLVIFFPLLVPLLALFGIIVAGVGLIVLVCLMVFVAILAALF